MNPQGKLVNGKVVGGIEWTKTVLPDGTERRGYTWNPIAGCHHGCRWTMPNGQVAECYAETTAERIAGSMYPHGFEHHYWHPDRLDEPLRVSIPSRIFMDSMSDMLGHWVPTEQIEQVMETCRKANWHTFQMLTKNPRRYKDFIGKFPKNVWRGASTPPDFMNGKALTQNMKTKMLLQTLKALNESTYFDEVTFLSAEPLSWDIVPVLERYYGAIDWVIIGAASSGRDYFPPDEENVKRLIEFCDQQQIKVFFKGNMKSLPWAQNNWREEFPA